MARQTNDVLLEKIENLQTDISEMKGTLDVLHKDYIERKAINKFMVVMISCLSAVVAWIATYIKSILLS